MSGSKVTAYIERYTSDGPQYETDLANAGARVVKIENDFERAKTLLATYPNLKVVYRDINRWEIEGPNFNWDYGTGTPEDAANTWFNLAMPTLYSCPVAHRARLYVNGGYNEVGELENADRLSWFGKFELWRAKLLRAAGFGSALVATSAEANLYDKWLPLRPLVAYAVVPANNCIFDTHGYNSPTLFDGGPSGNDVNFLFNHALLAAEIEAAGYTIPNGFFFYGEFGIDRINVSNKPYDGWLTTGCTAEDYVNQLAQADSVLMADRRVLAAAVYIWHNSPGMHTNYNLRFARQTRPGQFETPTAGERLLSYIASVPDTSPPPDPTPVPPPTQGAGKYRVTGTYLNIRAGQGTSTADIGDLTFGSVVTVGEPTAPDANGNRWAQLQGWVAVNLMEKL